MENRVRFIHLTYNIEAFLTFEALIRENELILSCLNQLKMYTLISMLSVSFFTDTVGISVALLKGVKNILSNDTVGER